MGFLTDLVGKGDKSTVRDVANRLKKRTIGTTQANMEMKCKSGHKYPMGSKILYDYKKLSPVCPECGMDLTPA